ncbi:hypothetical protein LTR84_008667 [Exophiala bonariae]|uniref:Uncharacterized protein n=1 Tax=Exophiala bonariae TaxID=1690606 RepID=A0AAV9MW57_9EURO|nr:hypothetical protein LTR84_008667 [Exophiala bonariae]
MRLLNLFAALAIFNTPATICSQPSFNLSDISEWQVPGRNGSAPPQLLLKMSILHGGAPHDAARLLPPNLPSAVRPTYPEGRTPCPSSDGCCMVGIYCTTNTPGQSGCSPNTTIDFVVTHIENGLSIPAGTSRGISPIATGSSSKLRVPTILSTFTATYQFVLSGFLSLANSKTVKPQDETGSDHTSSIENHRWAVDPNDGRVVERFVPPNFDKDAWLDDYEKRPKPKCDRNAAPRSVSNPFTYPVVAIGNMFRSFGSIDARPVIANDTATQDAEPLKGLGLGSALYDMWIRCMAMMD